MVTGSVNSPTAPANTTWDKLTHGFQASGVLQYYSALPFKHHVRRDDRSGHRRQPIVDGEFIREIPGRRRFPDAQSARSAARLRLAGRSRRRHRRVFNVTNQRNDLTRVGNFGADAYPTNPSPTFNQITAVGDPRAFQLGVRVRF